MLPQDRLKFGPLTATLKDGSILTLRLLEPGDADVLGDFYESIPREDHRHYAPHKLNRMQARIKAERMADSEHFICVIAVDKSKQIAGYAWCLWKRPEDESSVLGICIRRNYQRLGTGRSIMQRLLEIVRQAGPPRVQLTVNQANAGALNLYQKMGFTIVAEQMRPSFGEFAAEPEYRMQRMLR